MQIDGALSSDLYIPVLLLRSRLYWITWALLQEALGGLHFLLVVQGAICIPLKLIAALIVRMENATTAESGAGLLNRLLGSSVEINWSCLQICTV